MVIVKFYTIFIFTTRIIYNDCILKFLYLLFALLYCLQFLTVKFTLSNKVLRTLWSGVYLSLEINVQHYMKKMVLDYLTLIMTS